MPKFKGFQDIARAIDCINVYPNLLGLHHGLHQTLPDKYLGVSDGADHKPQNQFLYVVADCSMLSSVRETQLFVSHIT